LRFAQPRALGRKVSDEFTVPVCRVHHRELHRHGDEVSWWKRIDFDPLPIALKLQQHSRRNSTAATEGEDNGTFGVRFGAHLTMHCAQGTLRFRLEGGLDTRRTAMS
jgi:hypothetical protein